MVDHLQTHGFAIAALHLYKDKLIEVNTGESATTLLSDDYQTTQKSLIRGILRDAIGDAMIVEVPMKGKSRNVIINCWSTKSIMELTDDDSGLNEAYIDEYKKLESKRRLSRLK